MKLRSRLPLFTVLRLVTPSTVPVCWIVVGKDDSGGVRAYTLRSVGTGLEHRALFADVEQGIEDGLLVAEAPTAAFASPRGFMAEMAHGGGR